MSQKKRATLLIAVWQVTYWAVLVSAFSPARALLLRTPMSYPEASVIALTLAFVAGAWSAWWLRRKVAGAAFTQVDSR